MRFALLAIIAVAFAGCGTGNRPRPEGDLGNNGKVTRTLVDLCQPHGGVRAYSLAFGQNSLHGATAICRDNSVVETD